MKNIKIENFLNEMSYDLRLEELVNVFYKYQDDLIEFIAENAYSFKNRKLFNTVCNELRKEKMFNVISMLIDGDDEKVNPDMAYVLHAITNFNFVDEEMKGEALRLGYYLREKELGEVVPHLPTNICIIIASTKTIRTLEATAFLRTKYVENIIKILPGILKSAYGNEYKPREISKAVIFTIISKAVLDVKPQEIVTAFCKSDFPKREELSDEEYEFALRVRAFMYEVMGVLDRASLFNILTNTCESINRFNEKHGTNETFTGKYLNYKLLEVACEELIMKDKEKAKSMKIVLTYVAIKEFIRQNAKYKNLF